jgi:hypothetical protein
MSAQIPLQDAVVMELKARAEAGDLQAVVCYQFFTAPGDICISPLLLRSINAYTFTVIGSLYWSQAFSLNSGLDDLPNETTEDEANDA